MTDSTVSPPKHNNISDNDAQDVRMPNCGEIENQENPILEVRKIFRSEIKEYTTLTPWRTYLAITGVWITIGVAIAAALYSSLWIVWILAAIVIAGRQHALMILGHEAAHHRMSPNKAISEFVGDVFCFLPLFLSLRRWQHEHLLHHRYVNTTQDPYWDDFNAFEIWHWPKSKWQSIKALAADLVGVHSKANMNAAKRWSPFGKSDIPLGKKGKFRAVIFYLSLAIGLTLVNGWWVFILLWVVPVLTITTLFIRVRTLAEHIAIPHLDGTSGVDATRHVDANWLEKATVCPCNINYHIAHHIFPSVPYYNLPKCHKRLLEIDCYRQHAHLHKGYFGKDSAFSELTAANVS